MTSNTDTKTITELKAMGFSDDYVETPRRLIISSSGREKTGKSTFALTGPPPIIYLNVDVGTEGVVSKFQDLGKQVLLYDIRVPKKTSTTSSEQQSVYLPLWTSTQNAVKKAYSLHEGTVVWDTATEIYELARLAKLGKLTQVMPHNYVEVNNEFRELLRVAYDSPMNTVFIHKVKPKWVGGNRTSEYEVAGFGDMDYLAQVNLIHYREQTDEGVVFSAYIKDCRQNTSVTGDVLRGMPLDDGEQRTVDPLCNFEMLLSMVHGD